MKIKEDLKIWYGAFKRGLIVAGLYFFGNAVTLGLSSTNIKGAFIVAGGYMFLELAKKYGLQEFVSKQNLNNYRYLLFP